MKKAGHPLPFAQTVILSVAFTTICWLITAVRHCTHQR
jgi:hypothetical protein